MALSVLDRGEWAALWEGCVVNGKPLLAAMRIGDFPGGGGQSCAAQMETLVTTHTVLTPITNLEPTYLQGHMRQQQQ